jgi:broad specificity phosphatase PhoE
MEREALKLALEALESGEKMQYGRVGWIEYDSFLVKEAITAIKEALAQPADNPYGYDWSMLEAAQESLREHMARIKELEAQLAQPAQGHVAVVEFEPVIQGHEVWFPARCIASEIPTGTKLYTKPPKREWVGLTDEEIDALWQEWKDAVCLDHKTWAKAIEAALKDKNNGT